MVLETANERRVTGGLVQQLATLDTPELDDLIETLIAWTHQVVGEAEIVNAREQFFAENGKVFHDDSVYEPRMSYFFDLLLFERAFPNAHVRSLTTPYEHFLRQIDDGTTELPDQVSRRLKALGDFRHSIFQIAKVEERFVVLQDLLTNTKITVIARPDETFRGLERKTILQAFVFSLGELSKATYLSHGLVLHPAKATRVIRRILKQAQKSENFSRKTLLSRLATQQVRFLRHSHVDPKTIYLADPR